MPVGLSGDVYDYRGFVPARQLKRNVQFQRCDGLPLGWLLDIKARRPRPERLGAPAELALHHTMVVGPTGAGKTTGIVVPWIVELLRSGVSVVTVDVKGDLLHALRQYTSRYGSPQTPILRWGRNMSRSIDWNPLTWAQDDLALDRVAAAIAGGRRASAGSVTDPFFAERDHRWAYHLLGLIRDVGDRRLPLLPRLLNDGPALEAATAMPAGQRWRVGLSDLLSMDSFDRSRAASGLLNAVSIFASPDVQAITGGTDLTPDVLERGPVLIILGARTTDGHSAEILSSMALNLITHSLLGRPEAARQVCFAIDEAARLHDRIDLEELTSIGRSSGLGALVCLQDTEQLAGTSLSTIAANCATLYVLPGSSQESVKLLQGRLGERKAHQATFGVDARTTWTVTDQAVTGAREVQTPPFEGRPATLHSRKLSAAPLMVSLAWQ